MQYALTIPPAYETATTGLAMVAEKTIGKTHWKVEVYTFTRYPRIFKNDVEQKLDADFPPSFLKLYNAIEAMLDR